MGDGIMRIAVLCLCWFNYFSFRCCLVDFLCVRTNCLFIQFAVGIYWEGRLLDIVRHTMHPTNFSLVPDFGNSTRGT